MTKMTREKATNKLVNARYADEFQGDEELTTAHLMAIKALEQKPCTLDDAREDFVFDVYNILDFLPTNNEANQIIDVFDRVTSGLEQEPCEDAVSRKRLMDNYNGVETPVGYRKVVDLEVIKNMPPVTPTRKKGKWIEVWDKDHLVTLAYKCSECETMRNTKTNYYADCGAEMESEE